LRRKIRRKMKRKNRMKKRKRKKMKLKWKMKNKRKEKGIMDFSAFYPPHTARRICFTKRFSKTDSAPPQNLLHQHSHSRSRSRSPAKHTLIYIIPPIPVNFKFYSSFAFWQRLYLYSTCCATFRGC
jgi:hypothetical protein